MKADSFDKTLLALLVGLLVATVGMLLLASQQSGALSGNRARERTIATQARLLFIQLTYQPVEQLIKDNRAQEALLKLEELAVRYPGEAHGLLLKASLLTVLGADAQAITSYAAAVRLNGEYVDQKSPLSRRAEIARLTTTGLAKFLPESKSQQDNPSLRQVVRDLYYLQSRLAGGCE